MTRAAWLFPGQGAQAVGMGKALADRYDEARRVFDEANDALGFDLRGLCWDGPQAELDRTANAQPALVAASIAAHRSALAAGLPVDDPLCAGHSLGEFTALVAAGALDFADALRLVRRRGELMQRAQPVHPAGGPAGPGGMAAVLGLDADAVARAIEGTGLVVANDNAPGQVVISGPLSSFPAATAALGGAGAKRVLPLRVSAAFHSPAMRAVAPALATALASVRWRPLRHPVVANVDALAHQDSADFAALLERQVWSPVRWVDVVRRLAALGAAEFVEFGPGTVLTGLVKRIVPGARVANVGDPATLEAATARG